jgi:hypothetical protein
MRKISFSFLYYGRTLAESGKKKEEASQGAKYVCSQSTGCYSVPLPCMLMMQGKKKND